MTCMEAHCAQCSSFILENVVVKSGTNKVCIEPVPHKLRAPRTAPCTHVIGCRAAASSLRKSSTKVLADLLYLMKIGGYRINRFAECEGVVGGCNPPNSRNQTFRITIRRELRVPRQSSSFERRIALRSSLAG